MIKDEYLEKITEQLRILKEEKLIKNYQMSRILISMLPIMYSMKMKLG